MRDFRGGTVWNRPAYLMEFSPGGRLWATAEAVAGYCVGVG